MCDDYSRLGTWFLDISFVKNDFILNFSYVYVWVCTHVNAGAHSLKKVLDPQEPELQAVMSSLMWVLEVELESSVRAEGTLS